MTPEIKRFGEELREFINSDEIISILPEGDWGAGGCWILAEALKQYLGPPAELWSIVTLPEDRVQHVLVKDAGVFFDFLGAQTGQEALDNFLEVDPVPGAVGLVPLTQDRASRASESGIPCERKHVGRLVAMLKARFGHHEYH
jgi:hypothetical protein